MDSLKLKATVTMSSIAGVPNHARNLHSQPVFSQISSISRHRLYTRPVGSHHPPSAFRWSIRAVGKTGGWSTGESRPGDEFLGDQQNSPATYDRHGYSLIAYMSGQRKGDDSCFRKALTGGAVLCLETKKIH